MTNEELETLAAYLTEEYPDGPKYNSKRMPRAFAYQVKLAQHVLKTKPVETKDIVPNE